MTQSALRLSKKIVIKKRFRRIGMELETIFSIIDKAEKSSFSKFSIETQENKNIARKKRHALRRASPPPAAKGKCRRSIVRQQRRPCFGAYIGSVLRSERAGCGADM
jgi:hypothetical protein